MTILQKPFILLEKEAIMLFAFFRKDPVEALEDQRKKILLDLEVLAEKHAEILREQDLVTDLRRRIELIRERESSRDEIRSLVNEARKLKISDLEIEELIRKYIDDSSFN